MFRGERELREAKLTHSRRACGTGDSGYPYTELYLAAYSLSKGKQADIVLLRPTIGTIPINDLTEAVALGMDVSNVDTVLVAGRVMKRDGRLVEVDLDVPSERVYQSRDRVFARAGIKCNCPTHLRWKREPVP